MNLLRNAPDFKADLELNSVDITQLNDFIKGYAEFDGQQGTFFIITEKTVMNQKIDGYLKSFLKIWMNTVLKKTWAMTKPAFLKSLGGFSWISCQVI